MPTKLKVLVALLAVAAVVNVVQLAFLAAALDVVALIGVFRGSELVRTGLIVIGWVGLLIGAASSVALFMASLAAPDAAAVAIFLVVSLVVAALQCGVPGFMIWCLGQDDVERWMFRRSLNLGEDELVNE